VYQPVPRTVWLHTSVAMPAALARRRTMFQALMRSSGSSVSSGSAAVEKLQYSRPWIASAYWLSFNS
jgi:hypothetical protein